MRVVVSAAILAGVVAGLVAGSAAAGLQQLVIVEHGRFPVPPKGTFESGPPFCASGTWFDRGRVSGSTAIFLREHTCEDGSGALIISGRTTAHNVVPGPWTGTGYVVSGTGRYATLRGAGSFAGVDLDQLSFTETWTGMVDFDSVRPAVRLERLRASRLTTPRNWLAVSVVFTAQDDVAENLVAWKVSVLSPAGKTLATKKGSGTGKASVSLRMRQPAGAKSVRVTIEATDPVGNVRLAGRSLKLPA